VDEQREVALGEHIEQRAAPAVAGLVGERRRRQLEPDETAVELPGQAGGIDRRQAGRGPAGERRAQRGYPPVVGVEERPGVPGRQVLNADRARQADDRQGDAVARRLPGPAPGVVVGRVHRIRRLARGEQPPAVQPRRP
jgi:hypothetical protein